MRLHWKLLIIFAVLTIAGCLFFFIDPEKTTWAPKCVFHALTGWDCPGCGGQRAVHSLLHGHFKEAVLHNAFLVIAIPYIILLLVLSWLVPENRLVKLRKVLFHQITVYIYLTLFILWWILRNVFGW